MITGSPAVTVRLWIAASGVEAVILQRAFADDQHTACAVADLATRWRR
jgi:hypothetical protein